MKITLLILSFSLCAQAAQVTTNAPVKPMLAPGTVLIQTQPIVWTPSPDTNAIGTYVYGTTNASDFASMNAPTNYVLLQDAGGASSITMTNVTAGFQWYWTATAYDSSGNQSVHCNVYAKWMPLQPVQNLTAPPKE